MKKIIAFALTVCLVFAVAGVFASAVTLNPVENITSYTTPNVNGYGLEWYNDEEGEFKLFDGEIPDEDMLAVANGMPGRAGSRWQRPWTRPLKRASR